MRLDTSHGNSVAPLLISRQGYRKSTFCKRLLPEALQWGYNDNLVISEKQNTLRAMTQSLLINIDEFNALSAKTQDGFLKNVMQQTSSSVSLTANSRLRCHVSLLSSPRQMFRMSSATPAAAAVS